MSNDPTSPLVERRLRYVERQRVLQREAASLDARNTAPMGTGPRNRHGMPRVPTGQRVVSNRPVLDLADDRPGFWDVRGYSNTAEPWLDDRHSA